MPRGSGKNISLVNILVGQPVSEDASGNIRLADASHVAFAVAATGTPPRGVVTWQTDGIVTRTDWSHITGTKELVPGQRYYVSGTGLLSTSGSQQIGVARSKQDLRLEIQALSSTATTSPSSGTTHSAAPSGFQVIAGTSNANSLVSFDNSNGVSFGLSANTLTASVRTDYLTSVNVSAGTTSNNLSAFVFSNSNNVSFGLNGSTVTASASAQSNQSIGLYAASNTTQSSSGTQDARSLTFAGAGVASVGVTNGSVVISVPAGGGGITNVNLSAGTTSQNLSNFVFSNSNGVSFGLNGSTVTATVQTNYLTTAMQSNAATISNINVSAGTASNNLSNVVFSNSNNFSFGLSGSTVTGSYTVPTVTNSSWTVSDNATSATVGRLAFTQSNGLTLSLSTSNNGNHTVIGSYTVPTVTNSSWTVSDNATSATVGRLAFTQSNGLTLSLSTSNNGNHTVIGSYTVPTVTNSSMTVSDAATSGTLARLAFTNLNGITLSLSSGAGGSHTIVGSYTVPSVTNSSWTVSDNATSGTVGRLAFTNINGVTLSLSSGTGGLHTIVGSHNALTSQSNQAFSAGGGSSAFQTLSFANSFNVSFTNSNGSVAASISTSLTNINISAGATSNNLSNWVYSNSNNVSFGLTGSTITASYQPPCISWFENMEGIAVSTTQSVSPGSVSMAVAFILPEPLSASFIRLPILLTTNSTTLSTLAASMNGSAQITSTWNAVIYSIGSGGSSRSLMSAASGSCSWVMNNSISVAANGTQGSYTQAMSYAVEGVNTNTSTQFSISNTNYSFVSTNWQSNYTGSRFLDINFANSLSAGAYWLIFGLSTSSNSNSVRCSAATNCNLGYASHYAISQATVAFGIMGSTNLSSGVMLGAGSFSTNGGGTTANLPISAISSSSNHARAYFQMIRSA